MFKLVYISAFENYIQESVYNYNYKYNYKFEFWWKMRPIFLLVEKKCHMEIKKMNFDKMDISSNYFERSEGRKCLRNDLS